MTAEILLQLTRGNGVIENTVRGHIAMVKNNKLIFSKGDSDTVCFTRSSAKPFQTLPVVLDGVDTHFHLNHQELAIMCASHYGEQEHIDTVKSILKKIGLDHTAIQSGITNSLSYDVALELARDNVTLNTLHGDCSGKHAGMLALCRYHNWDLNTYLLLEHPCQQSILNSIAYMADMNKKELKLGLDGCSAINVAMPLHNLARAYQRFTNTDLISNAHYLAACQKVANAISEFPFMLSGTNGFCTKLIEATNGRIIGKIGADGIYGLGIKNENIGIAIKTESNDLKMLPYIVVAFLQSQSLLRFDELKALNSYINAKRYTDKMEIAGEIICV